MAKLARHVYDQRTLGSLADKIRKMPKQADEAMSLAINKTATASIRESVDRISTQTTLQPSYIRQNINTTKRAKPSNLRAVVTARARATLTGRFAHIKTKDGVRLKVNRSGGYREIKKGWVAKNLRNSRGVGIAQTYERAYETFKDQINSGKGATPGKLAKLARLAERAKTRPKGMYVTHSRSINQMFTSVREDIEPVVVHTLAENFIADFKRKTKS